GHRRRVHLHRDRRRRVRDCRGARPRPAAPHTRRHRAAGRDRRRQRGRDRGRDGEQSIPLRAGDCRRRDRSRNRTVRRAMTKTRRQGWSSERGTAILETAMTLPLLLLVSVGIFEFGRAYQTWQVMTNAAREGARVAILPNAANGATDARVRQYLQMGGLVSDSSVGVVVTPVVVAMGGVGTASGSQVTVTYPFSF